MDFTGVYHKASEQMCYPLNEDELIVNLKTGYDVKRVFIYYGDPFEAGILGGKEQWAGKKGSKLYLGVEFRTFLIFDIKIGIGVTLSYN